METSIFSFRVRIATLILLLLLIGFLLSRYCCPTPVGGEGAISVRAPIQAPHGIAFIDVGNTTSNVQKVKVTLIDPAGKVVSSNGVAFSSVEVMGGVMSIGLAADATVSADTPYSFHIRAEADGYMPNLLPVVITEDKPGYVPIYMTRLDALPPSGLGASVGELSTVSGGVLTRPAVLRTKSKQGNVPGLALGLPEGLRFLSNGKAIEQKGNLSFQLLFGIPRDSNANRVFPGGFEVVNAVNSDGKPIATPANPFFFTTGGWFTAQMSIGNQVVDGFSKPVLVEMPIGDTVINPITNKPVQAGQEFPLWSMNEQTGQWRQESTVKVEQGSDGQLKVNFSITHLSTWNLDIPAPVCAGTATINYDPAQFTAGAQYWTRIISRNNGADLATRSLTFNAPGPLNLVRIPASAEPLQMLVHNGADASFPLGWMTTAGSGDFNCTNNSSTLNLVSAPAACAEIEFLVGTDNLVHCNNSIWYRNNCAVEGLYTFGGVLNSAGQASIPDLGVSRCIRLWYLDDATGSQVTLDVTINFAIASGSSGSDPNARVTVGGGAPTTHTVTYTKSASASCNYRITVTIPATAVSVTAGSGC